MVNAPIYRLQHVDISDGHLAATVGMARFADYAMTLDLLEPELIDAIAAGKPVTPGSLPLRDYYRPDTGAVADLSCRLCAGGPLALMAIARPASRRRAADYLFLIQERSANVLNSARRLAVIPKAFHEPMVDFAALACRHLLACGQPAEDVQHGSQPWVRTSQAVRNGAQGRLSRSVRLIIITSEAGAGGALALGACRWPRPRIVAAAG
jgi:hypothetical protein